MGQAPTRLLGPVALFALGLNGVVGVGIFFVPASVAQQVPGAPGALVYVLTALACVPIAWSFARLGPRFDEDGGPYVYARAAFGPRVAFVMGWLTYVSAVFSTAAVIRGLSEALTTGGSVSLPPRAVASIVVLLLTLLVAVGLRVTAWAWTGITVAKLVPLACLIAAWLWMTGSLPEPVAGMAENSPDASSFLRAGLIVLFALQGFEIIAVPAGHVRSRRSIATATMMVLGVAVALYVALHLACVRALPDLAGSASPIVDAARVYGGDWLARALYVGTSLSAGGIALGMVAMSPRYLSTLGRADGLGEWLGSNNERGVPMRALVLTSLAVFGLVQVGRLDQLFAMASIAVLAQYGSTSASLVWMAVKGRLGLGRIDVAVGLLALACVLVVMTGATFLELVRAGAVVLAGVVVKVVVGRRAR
jgi:amino acid transporter